MGERKATPTISALSLRHLSAAPTADEKYLNIGKYAQHSLFGESEYGTRRETLRN